MAICAQFADILEVLSQEERPNGSLSEASADHHSTEGETMGAPSRDEEEYRRTEFVLSQTHAGLGQVDYMVDDDVIVY